MGESNEFEEEIFDEDESEIRSLNHGIIQGQLLVLLSADKRFRAIPELTLDTSQIDLTQFALKAKKEFVPDICIYPNTIKRQRRDILRMTEMPLSIMEVVSPMQSNEEILIKFDAYFALGI